MPRLARLGRVGRPALLCLWAAACAPAAAEPPAPAAAPAAAPALVLVRAGDTVEGIAARLGLSPAQLRAQNGLRDGDPIEAGQLLEAPLRAGEQVSGGLVLSLSGEARLSAAGLPERPVRAGEAVPVGSLLCTGAESHLTVRMAWSAREGGHDDVNLMPGTCVTLAAAHARPGARLSVLQLQRGSVVVPPQRPGEGGGTVTVQTEDGVATAEAGGFRVHREAAASRTEALDTPMTVFGAGVEQPLAAGEGSRVARGGAPSRPVPLLRPGQLLSPAPGAELRRAELRWTPVERALSYQVELSVTEDFRELTLIDRADDRRYAPAALSLPYRVPGLHWRVSPVDRTGFIGLPSEGRPLALPRGIGP